MSIQAAPKPQWLKVRAPGGENYARLKQMFRKLDLHTVCEEASCPNVGECWGGGTATLMLLGDTCTRGCRFCHVKTGKPNGVVDVMEPIKVGGAIGSMGLTYVVLTSVDRDDLPDGGADHFGRTVEEIKKKSPDTLVEVLVPDFRGDLKAMERIVQSGADVIAHNLETVERLTKRVRDPRCGYQQSLDVLAHVKRVKPKAYTKSSLMVGLGETQEEMAKAMDDLRAVGVDILTIGQYLRPSAKHLPVEEFVHPTVFKAYEEMGLAKGFKFVPSGPLVRSSYKAGEKFIESQLRSEAGKA
jgi:lipoyl synthase